MISTPDFPDFAARLRGFIHACERRSLSKSDSDSTFSELALELFALQFAANAPYRRHCEARGTTPESIRNWSQIPAVPTAGFKELELSCLAPHERTSRFHSSGTTEQRPSRHFHSSESLEIYEASLWSWFAANVLEPCRPIADCQMGILTPRKACAPHSSLVHMFDTIRRRCGSPESVIVGGVTHTGDWTVSHEAVIEALRKSSTAKMPVVLLGTAFLFVHLLDALNKCGITFKLPHGSLALETGGYKGRSRTLPKPELHALITSRFGIAKEHIVCEYGMSELSSQAYDVTLGANPGASRRFRFPPWARAQIISPETGDEVAEGETGLIRVYDLANVYSVMALQTEDLGIRLGDGFELLGRATLAEPRGCSLMALDT